jgi:serine/threonine-protein kinase
VGASIDALAACSECGAVHPGTMLRCPETDVMLPLAGRLLDGRFRLLQCIGRGGMASVWLARNERVDRDVAIKLIRADVARDDDLVARFRAEARAAGRIGHPNICDILDSGRSPIGPYIVMELLQGGSLGDLLAGGAKLEPHIAVMLAREALRGLGAAHRAGIVHRDLKPENIFLHRPAGWPERGEPTVKLMDFGVAKFTDGTGEARTEHGALLGTPEFMAPEQFRGATFAEPRTDIWAMGAILYRALTGRNAFGGPTVAATLIMVASEEPTPLLELAPDTPTGLVDVVNRCLRKQADRRFADVAELDLALAPFDSPTRDVSPWAALGPEPPLESTQETEPPQISRPNPTRVWTGPTDVVPRRPNRRTHVAASIAIASLVGFAAWQLRITLDARTEPVTEQLQVVDVEPTTPTFAAAEQPREPTVPREAIVPDDAIAAAPTLSNTPPPPPPPSADDDVVVLEPTPTPTPESPSPSNPAPADPPADPAGVVRVGRWVALTSAGPAGTLRKASDWCEGLARVAHLGIRRWELPNPATAAKLAGKKGIRKGRYWTSALWRGKALSVALPAGTTKSIPATSTKPRTLCVARWP